MSSLQTLRRNLFHYSAAVLSLFVLAEVNYPRLSPQSQLAIFAMLGLVLVFLKYPLHSRLETNFASQYLDFALVLSVIVCFGYIVIQTEPLFRWCWIDKQSLGDRAGIEAPIDVILGFCGLILVLEGARRAIGLTLPLVALAFLLYAALGTYFPGWLSHRGYSVERIVSQTFLHSQGALGVALKVMFTYVFLFVLFGGILEKTGATSYIINLVRRLFRSSTGGAAKVAVISSGMMGSLSGSAVANTATTGTITIPMMRSAGFRPTTSGGIEAAASSGGALVPPIMGAGVYMMLEIVAPPVTYLQIIRSAVIPAVLYYAALLLSVHFRAKKVGATGELSAASNEESNENRSFVQGLVFYSAFSALVVFLILGYTPFRAVTLSLIGILILSAFNRHTRLGFRECFDAMTKVAQGGIPLIAAACCVGLILGVVLLTGVGLRLPGLLLPLAQDNLILALVLLMISTIVLGMGLPSSVCYLLMATFVGSILPNLGIVPLAGHFFIFYFGMMSMVTPPVALASYTAAAIASADIMKTGFAAFRFSLVGFALPYAFVLRPELLTLSPDGGLACAWAIASSVGITALGILPLAASIGGYLFRPLDPWQRVVLLLASGLLILTPFQIWFQVVGGLIFGGIGFITWRSRVKREVE